MGKAVIQSRLAAERELLMRQAVAAEQQARLAQEQLAQAEEQARAAAAATARAEQARETDPPDKPE